MNTFFKDGNVLVDVDGGNVIDTSTGKMMTINLTNMTMKSFTTKTKLTPIRFSSNNKGLLVWESVRNRWADLKEKYPKSVTDAIEKLIQAKIEKDLLE